MNVVSMGSWLGENERFFVNHRTSVMQYSIILLLSYCHVIAPSKAAVKLNTDVVLKYYYDAYFKKLYWIGKVL